MRFSTIGREYHPGYEAKLYCVRNVDSLDNDCINERYRIVSVKEGSGVFTNGDSSQIVASPAVLCLNEQDKPGLHSASGLLMDIIYFEPTCFERYITFESIQAWKDTLTADAWFFRPFFRRGGSYIGALSASRFTASRASQLIELTDRELTEQSEFWPCRSRSFFIELLLLVSSVYDKEDEHEKQSYGRITDEIIDVVDWLHSHYLEKITVEAVTREFHTNKTTLNQKFKSVLGVTVTEYINNIRVQAACSFLRKTYLSVNEIMERSGYRDDAHFLRSFKKRVGCPPSEYRKRFESS